VAAKFEIRAANGGWTWMATSQGRTLAIGETYTTKAAAANAIASLRKGAPTAPIVDLTSRPAKSAARKTVRATGRAVGTAVAKSGRAVEKAEKTAAGAAKTTTRAAKKTVGKAKATPPKAGAKKTGTPRKRASRSG
jgi:DNA-binding protein HU-beta